MSERVVVALGGNAIAGERGADPESQQIAVEGACEQIAELVGDGHEVAITHGNGPQVGNLLLKNDLARQVVPPVPLDWCVAQTQATLGFLIVTALEAALARRGAARMVATVVTRVLVDRDDPAWERPTKPIGRYVDADEAAERIAAGEAWEDRGERGWRRMVPSPRPLEILDRATVEALIADGAIVVAAGGGGIPMVRDDGRLRGVEAVLDKDLTAALLARTIGAGCLLIATDVEAAAIGYGTDGQRVAGRGRARAPARAARGGRVRRRQHGPEGRGRAGVRRGGVGHHVAGAAARGRRGHGRDAGGAVTERVIVRRGAYYDSVTLMLVSQAAGASVGMATPLNLELLADQGFTIDEDVGPNDLVIAVRADDVDAVVAAVDRELAAKGGAPSAAVERPAARSLAVRRPPRPRAQPRVPLDPGRARGARGGGRAGGRPARVLLLGRREPRGRGAAQAAGARARAAVHGRRLRHRDHRRRRARVRQRGASGGRWASSAPPAPAPRRCAACSTPPASGCRTRSASAAATCRPRSAG